MVEYFMKGEYPVELQGRYARSNFRRKASHYQVRKLQEHLFISPLHQLLHNTFDKHKCQQLEISFRETFEQQPTLLSKIIPWQTEKISMDGNCFFRCISKNTIRNSRPSCETPRRSF